MLRPFNESKKKWPNGKKILIGLTLLVVVIAVIGFYLYYNSSLLFNPPEVKVIEGTYTLNDVIAVSNNVVAFAGANLSNNISEGIAGEYFLQNSSYLFFNLGEYLQDGTIYSIAYNGSSFLLAGAQSIKENNVTVLQPEVVLYTNGKAINISKLIPDTYTPGQASLGLPKVQLRETFPLLTSILTYHNAWIFPGGTLIGTQCKRRTSPEVVN